jgi:hypothetical protein
VLDAFLDDGFLIPTFEQLAALQIEYKGRILGAHCNSRVLYLLSGNTSGGLGSSGWENGSPLAFLAEEDR